MGVGDFIANPQPFEAPHSKSVFIPDYIINPHPRFAALATNVRSRRGEKVDIQVPLFPDVNTPEFAPAPTDGASSAANLYALPPGYSMEPDKNIHMDAMGFGMGMCCLVSCVTGTSNFYSSFNFSFIFFFFCAASDIPRP
jgi:glutamate--cysteine ligase catalytic subunit